MLELDEKVATALGWERMEDSMVWKSDDGGIRVVGEPVGRYPAWMRDFQPSVKIEHAWPVHKHMLKTTGRYKYGSILKQVVCNRLQEAGISKHIANFEYVWLYLEPQDICMATLEVLKG